jgi:RNA polymerase sigma factor (sigma-70 family)
MAEKLNMRKKDYDFIETYKNYYPFIIKYCTARTGGNIQLAEDCTQDTFFVLYKKYCDGIEIEYPKAFLCRTCDNILLNKKSKLSKELSNQTEDEFLDNIIFEEKQFYNIEYEELLAIIKNNLSDSDEEIFNLRYIDELSLKEISKKTSMTITGLTTRLSRIRKNLQTKLEKY